MKHEVPSFVAEHVSPHLNAKRGWLTIAGLVAVYELTCPDNELLSEGVDRALESHKALTIAAIGYTAAHLANLLPDKLDLFQKIWD